MANELILYGSVGDSFWGEDSFTAKGVRESLANMSGDVTVRINSGGGVSSEGQAIYILLKDYPGKVDVVVDAVAASAASLICMAGDTITMRTGSVMMIHDPAQPWSVGRGTEDDHKRTAAALAVIANAFASVYAKRADINMAEARRIMKDEVWLDGEMAMGMGFATATEETPALELATWTTGFTPTRRKRHGRKQQPWVTPRAERPLWPQSRASPASKRNQPWRPKWPMKKSPRSPPWWKPKRPSWTLLQSRRRNVSVHRGLQISS